MDIKLNGFYVYRFLNYENEVIYVGRTKNLNHRLTTQHFTKKGHLPQSCYKETKTVEYIELDSENAMRIYEIYYISKHKPIFNFEYNNEDLLGFELPNIKWKTVIELDNHIDKKAYLKIKPYDELLEMLNKADKKIDEVSNFVITFIGNADSLNQSELNKIKLKLEELKKYKDNNFSYIQSFSAIENETPGTLTKYKEWAKNNPEKAKDYLIKKMNLL